MTRGRDVLGREVQKNAMFGVRYGSRGNIRSALNRHTIEVTSGQSFVRCQTMELPARTELHTRDGQYLVLKVPTHTFSSGQSRGHAVASFYVFEIVKATPVRGGENIETDFLLMFPTRRK